MDVLTCYGTYEHVAWNVFTMILATILVSVDKALMYTKEKIDVVIDSECLILDQNMSAKEYFENNQKKIKSDEEVIFTNYLF